MAWTQPGTLDWYQRDDPHDRGFEAEARPKPDGHTWSDDWAKAGGWSSNLPDPYRDDLTSDDEYKKFAIGSANGRALKYQKKYFGWYNTDDGGSDTGQVLQMGQRTTRARRGNPEQWFYCHTHDNADKACFFGSNENEIQDYPIENEYHRKRRTWG